MAVWVVQRRLSQKLLMFIKQFCVDVHYDLVYAKLTLLMWQYFEWGYNVLLVWVLLICWRLGQVFSTYLFKSKEILALFLASRENLIFVLLKCNFHAMYMKNAIFFHHSYLEFCLVACLQFQLQTMLYHNFSDFDKMCNRSNWSDCISIFSVTNLIIMAKL